jgi:hypothetical protein
MEIAFDKVCASSPFPLVSADVVYMSKVANTESFYKNIRERSKASVSSFNNSCCIGYKITCLRQIRQNEFFSDDQFLKYIYIFQVNCCPTRCPSARYYNAAKSDF